MRQAKSQKSQQAEPRPLILIADESGISRRAITRELARGNYDIVEAHDGREAVAQYRQHRPALVILSVTMAGMDGFMACQRIMEVASQLRGANGQQLRPRVIFTTTRDTLADRMRGLEVGASDFIIKPVARGHLLQLAHLLLDPPRPYQGRRALVADDSALVRRIVVETLEHQGFEAHQALNGQEALNLLEGPTGDQSPYDLVVCDFNMPHLNGDEVCKAVRANPALHGVPVLVMSAITSMETVFEALRAGASDFIPKPFVKEVFLSRLHALMDAPTFPAGITLPIAMQAETPPEAMSEGLPDVLSGSLHDGLRDILLAANYLTQAKPGDAHVGPLAGKIKDMASSLLNEIAQYEAGLQNEGPQARKP